MGRTHLKVDDPEYVRLIDETLEATGGNKMQAAKVLGIERKNLYEQINRSPVLAEKWLAPKNYIDAKKSLTEAEQINRGERVVSPAERQTSEAIEGQDDLLSKGIDGLSVSDEDKKFLLSVASFSGMPTFKRVMDLTYGGMVVGYKDLILIRRQLVEKLDEIRANPESFNDINENGVITHSAHKKEMEIIDRINAISKEARCVNESAEKAYMTRMKIDELENARLGEGSKRAKKAGFSPPPIDV